MKRMIRINYVFGVTMFTMLLLSINGIVNAQKSGVMGKRKIVKPAVEPGVSIALARYRAATLKNIVYRLGFTIPTQTNQPVEASEEINFTWTGTQNGSRLESATASPATVPLQLDFRDSARAVHELAVNGHKIPILLSREHLLIDGSLLKQGANTIGILFTAGGLSLNRNPDFLYTLLVPDRARTLFPCFDQPDLKAIFTLSLDLPKDWKALANGPLQDSLDEGDHKRYQYLPSDKIPTYLFSFAAGRFEVLGKEEGRPMHFYYRETDSAKLKMSLDSVFRIQARAIRWLEDYTGIPYPFQKFDFVAIPDFQFGGMEHPGAIQYRASTLFLPEGATRDQLIARVGLLSHETAHMWFGDLVTMRWFNDVWMKEVFANFMADKIAQVTQSDDNSDLKFLTGHLPAAYSTDRTAGTNPIRQPLENLQDAGSLYGNIIYHKAPVMMRQLEALIGVTAFREGLREYLHRYAYGNASWSELIGILDSHTPKDLKKWNEVWVEKPGRPRFSYRLKTKKDKIQSLTVYQKGEDGKQWIWPQSFKIALVYRDHVESLPLFMDGAERMVSAATGKKTPLYLVFNAGGEGYGLFPAEGRIMSSLFGLKDPVMRASAYINLYENMLDGRAISPAQLLAGIADGLPFEKEELNLSLLLEQLQSVFWRFLPAAQRSQTGRLLENRLWNTMLRDNAPLSNVRKLLFLGFCNIAIDRQSQDSIFGVWKDMHPPAGIKLAEEDYTSLATGLALRQYPGWKKILEDQLARIQNADNRRRLEFLLPSLSDDQAERDRFFASLKSQQNRQKESWVLTALGYLHHPLRGGVSEKYILPGLDLLEEVHSTGGVFFPQNWLQATLGYYTTPSAAAIVKQFLRDHAGYDARLRQKILQSSDNLFRAVKLNANQ